MFKIEAALRLTAAKTPVVAELGKVIAGLTKAFGKPNTSDYQGGDNVLKAQWRNDDHVITASTNRMELSLTAAFGNPEFSFTARGHDAKGLLNDVHGILSAYVKHAEQSKKFTDAMLKLKA